MDGRRISPDRTPPQNASHMSTTDRHPRHLTVTTGLLLGAALIAGCGAQSETFGKHAATPAKAAVARPVGQDYAFADKAAFITDMSAELADIAREFDRLIPRVGAASTPVPTLESLRGLSASLNRRLDEARTATEAEWPDLTAAFRQDLGRLKTGLEQSRQKLSGSSVQ